MKNHGGEATYMDDASLCRELRKQESIARSHIYMWEGDTEEGEKERERESV